MGEKMARKLNSHLFLMAVVGFLGGAQLAQAAPKARVQTDLSSPPDVAEFVTAIALETARAQINGRDQDYEKFLTFGRDANGKVVVTGIAVLNNQGGDVARLMGSGVIAAAHVHWPRLRQVPMGGDDGIARFNNLPSFVISGDGRQVFEIGRTNGVISIRSVRSGGPPGPWEAFQSSGKYRYYGDGS